jgi:hypothetical protein
LPFGDRVARDFVALGCVGAIVAMFLGNEVQGVSFLAALIWLALNTVLLARLLEVVMLGGRNGAGVGLLLGCAKIPASYAILYWLYQVPYLDRWGLTVGVLCLPVVLVARGIAWRQHQVSEEGR